jgi:hypothetical protein
MLSSFEILKKRMDFWPASDYDKIQKNPTR